MTQRYTTTAPALCSDFAWMRRSVLCYGVTCFKRPYLWSSRDLTVPPESAKRIQCIWTRRLDTRKRTILHSSIKPGLTWARSPTTSSSLLSSSGCFGGTDFSSGKSSTSLSSPELCWYGQYSEFGCSLHGRTRLRFRLRPTPIQ